jgi:tRNA G18 (ribose-2'-O)-methylase SpoU
MTVIRIDRIDDPRLDDYRNVSDAELLRQRKLFVGEGRFVVRRLLSSGHAMASLLLNESSLASLDAEAIGQTPVYLCPNAELAEILGFKFHRGCLALAHRPVETRPVDLMRDTGDEGLLILLDGVTDPDNVGSAFRNAAAFGVDGVLLSACCDPLYRKAVRTSMGHVLQLPHARLPDLAAGLTQLKSSGFMVMALTPASDAIPLSQFVGAARTPGKIALVVGGEAEGLSAAAEQAADIRVRIPMHHGVDSLNLSTALGIALHRLTGLPSLS